MLFEKQRARQKETQIFPPLVDFPNAHNKVRLDQAKARNLELLPGLSCGWQGPNSLSHDPAAQGAHLQEAGVRSGAETWRWVLGVPKDIFVLNNKLILFLMMFT